MPLPRRHTPREPSPHPSPDTLAPPRPAPSCTATSSQPPPIHLPSFPTNLRPSPTMHLPFLEAGGHAPALALGSLRLPRARLLSRWSGRRRPRAPLRAPPLPCGGRGALPVLPERRGPPPSRACLVLLGRRGLVPLPGAGEKRGGSGALLRENLIRELRLPFYPTGRHCLNGRSTQKGEKGTGWSQNVGLETWNCPEWHNPPLSLTGSPRPHATSPLPPPHPSSPHTHRPLECLYSLFWFPENLS